MIDCNVIGCILLQYEQSSNALHPNVLHVHIGTEALAWNTKRLPFLSIIAKARL